MLALHLVFEAGNPAAAGHAYAASLPAPDAPALWPAEALAALAGTRTHGRVMARRGFVATVHQALFGDGGALPRERFAWALAVVLSRALSGSGAPYTLVPALDILNHADVATVAHSFDAAAGEFVVTALRPHARGEQLFLSYGASALGYATTERFGCTASPRHATRMTRRCCRRRGPHRARMTRCGCTRRIGSAETTSRLQLDRAPSG